MLSCASYGIMCIICKKLMNTDFFWSACCSTSKHLIFGSPEIRTRDGWMWSANTTSVLCSPPITYSDQLVALRAAGCKILPAERTPLPPAIPGTAARATWPRRRWTSRGSGTAAARSPGPAGRPGWSRCPRALTGCSLETSRHTRCYREVKNRKFSRVHFHLPIST